MKNLIKTRIYINIPSIFIEGISKNDSNT